MRLELSATLPFFSPPRDENDRQNLFSRDSTSFSDLAQRALSRFPRSLFAGMKRLPPLIEIGDGQIAFSYP